MFFTAGYTRTLTVDFYWKFFGGNFYPELFCVMQLICFVCFTKEYSNIFVTTGGLTELNSNNKKL